MSEMSTDALRLVREEVARRLVEKQRAYERERRAKWRDKNAEKEREGNRKRYAGDPQKALGRTRKWKAANPERARELRNAWSAANREKVRVQNRRWKAVDREARATRPRPEVCEACGKPCKTGRVISFDHCHASDKFRGWLCNPCNLALGHLDDNPKRLRQLLVYLKKYDI